MDLTRRAQELRKTPTDAERRLWNSLRRRRFADHKFRRQVPLGNYIVDFMCRQGRLVVEVDGAQHADQQAYDVERDDWLRTQGFQVLRFTDREVLTALGSVDEAIWVALRADPLPNPPP